MLPLLLDLSRHACLVVGGGDVGARKARSLIDAGAKTVRAVAPDFVEAFPTAVDRLCEAYAPRFLDGMAIVFAATNRAAVNDAIVRDARDRNIWVNRVDASDDWPGNFSTPACWRDESVTVAVSAGSAALSARLRDELRSRWEPRWSAMASAMQTLRPEIKRNRDEAGRRDLLRALAEDEPMDVLAEGGIDALRRWIATRTL